MLPLTRFWNLRIREVRIHNYSGADILLFEDVPRPMSRSVDVLIRVHAAEKALSALLARV
jgi:NADPH:quinone reductase-like Zn-dependent oxidoreductase